MAIWPRGYVEVRPYQTSKCEVPFLAKRVILDRGGQNGLPGEGIWTPFWPHLAKMPKMTVFDPFWGPKQPYLAILAKRVILDRGGQNGLPGEGIWALPGAHLAKMPKMTKNDPFWAKKGQSFVFQRLPQVSGIVAGIDQSAISRCAKDPVRSFLLNF